MVLSKFCFALFFFFNYLTKRAWLGPHDHVIWMENCCRLFFLGGGGGGLSGDFYDSTLNKTNELKTALS